MKLLVAVLISIGLSSITVEADSGEKTVPNVFSEAGGIIDNKSIVDANNDQFSIANRIKERLNEKNNTQKAEDVSNEDSHTMKESEKKKEAMEDYVEEKGSEDVILDQETSNAKNFELKIVDQETNNSKTKLTHSKDNMFKKGNRLATQEDFAKDMFDTDKFAFNSENEWMGMKEAERTMDDLFNQEADHFFAMDSLFEGSFMQAAKDSSHEDSDEESHEATNDNKDDEDLTKTSSEGADNSIESTTSGAKQSQETGEDNAEQSEEETNSDTNKDSGEGNNNVGKGAETQSESTNNVTDKVNTDKTTTAAAANSGETEHYNVNADKEDHKKVKPEKDESQKSESGKKEDKQTEISNKEGREKNGTGSTNKITGSAEEYQREKTTLCEEDENEVNFSDITMDDNKEEGDNQKMESDQN